MSQPTRTQLPLHKRALWAAFALVAGGSYMTALLAVLVLASACTTLEAYRYGHTIQMMVDRAELLQIVAGEK